MLCYSIDNRKNPSQYKPKDYTWSRVLRMPKGQGGVVAGWTLLRSNPVFRGLWLASIGSQLGNWLSQVGLATITLQTTHSAESMGLVLLARGVPAVALRSLVGPLVDRMRKRPVMITTELIRSLLAFSFSLALWWHATWILYVDSFLFGLSGIFFGPARHATMPDIVRASDLLSANALSSQSQGAVQIVGAALGGWIAQVSPVLCFSINAATYLWSAWHIARVHWMETSGKTPFPPYFGALKDGLGEIRHNRIVRSIILNRHQLGIGGQRLLHLRSGFMTASLSHGCARHRGFVCRGWIGSYAGRLRTRIVPTWGMV